MLACVPERPVPLNVPAMRFPEMVPVPVRVGPVMTEFVPRYCCCVLFRVIVAAFVPKLTWIVALPSKAYAPVVFAPVPIVWPV